MALGSVSRGRGARMNGAIVRRSLALTLSSVALIGGIAQAASAASKTTAPGQVYIVKMTLTNTAIIIPPDKFSIGLKYPRYPRGAAIQYKVTNKGSKPYSVQIWAGTTAVIRPGHTDSILLNWNYRGNYLYRTLYRGKPAGPHGYVTIF
jgi:hypothetical protein